MQVLHHAWATRALLLSFVLYLPPSQATAQDSRCQQLEKLLENEEAELDEFFLDDYQRSIQKGDRRECEALLLRYSLDSRESLDAEIPRGSGPGEPSVLDNEDLDRILNSSIDVVDSDGNVIGQSEGVVFESTGEITSAIIGVGGFLGIGERRVAVNLEDLQILPSENDSSLVAYIGATEDELEALPSFEASVDLTSVRASRDFMYLDQSPIDEFTGFGVVAFRRLPAGSLAERAQHICHGFLLSISSVVEISSRGANKDRQVVTAWPVGGEEIATSLNERAGNLRERDAVCEQAINGYDWIEGDNAIREAAKYFSERGKEDIAERISSPDQDGPWLLAWAPGGDKGRTDDDVLVLAFDLSFIDDRGDAERAFQAWRVNIEERPELWSDATISNTSWSSAIIGWANDIGESLSFYRAMGFDG